MIGLCRKISAGKSNNMTSTRKSHADVMSCASADTSDLQYKTTVSMYVFSCYTEELGKSMKLSSHMVVVHFKKCDNSNSLHHHRAYCYGPKQTLAIIKKADGWHNFIIFFLQTFRQSKTYWLVLWSTCISVGLRLIHGNSTTTKPPQPVKYYCLYIGNTQYLSSMKFHQWCKPSDIYK